MNALQYVLMKRVFAITVQLVQRPRQQNITSLVFTGAFAARCACHPCCGARDECLRAIHREQRYLPGMPCRALNISTKGTHFIQRLENTGYFIKKI